ncbi:Beta-glucan synthesis-associated protein [Seminavis robusta]|uniref:Beta-glucan synthesis-associated protein n=1 Tax=Seminavis robusta TaxID=568900 RepID=A0A9N8DI46_9STRA|nr:Beta-glucan synthesis-associated protein [Seminavis robusta]|eukprot:Sro157_g071200.1 Beta-glucan synthesis-associated protein (693) ;mRNA; f:53499-55775
MIRKPEIREMANELGQETKAQSRSMKLQKGSVCHGVFSSRALILILCLFAVANGDWIDPDTPEEVMTTTAYTVIPPPKPTAAPSISYDDDFYFDDDLLRLHNNSTKRKPKRLKPTKAPTKAPTLQPTEPSASPSAYPTATAGAYKLVFSDEFNLPGRSFDDGTDPRWTALDKNDYTNNAQHYYSPGNAYTNDKGELVIKTEAADTDVVGFDDVKREKTHVTKHFRSAMLQTWNKFCFTGGIIEAEVVLPGRHDVGGLWPAFWLLGNLARHTYVGSSEHIWPWSEVKCTKKSRDSQRLSACHKVAHYGMKAGVGRGAPEMDIFEVQPGNVHAGTGPFKEMPVGQPFMSSSFQVAPGRADIRPGNGYWPGPGQWYEGLIGGMNSTLNIQFYGSYNHFRGDYNPAVSDYWSDALSFNQQLNETHFKDQHKYRLEWQVPTEDQLGHLHWFLDGQLVLAINGESFVKNGMGSEISSEPSYILFNTAVSSEWGFPKECPENCPCKKYNCYSNDFREKCGFSEGFCPMMEEKPAEMKVNWVRVYQDPADPTQKVGCSTPERPTRQYIEAHAKSYKQENDVTPLKGIQTGRGRCDPAALGEIAAACGGSSRGHCTRGAVCECDPDWTGPHCLAHRGRDPILYDSPDRITDVGFELPFVQAARFLVFALAFLGVCLFLNVRCKKKIEGWEPIPDMNKQLHA